MRFNYVIVGAGLAGATIAERIASQLDEEVLVIEKRKHIAGNCYDFYDDAGILVHKYGPHIFHTKIKEVWDYLSNFTDWHLYQHRVLSYVDGKLVPIPINLDTVNELFGTNLTVEELPEFLERIREPINEIKTSADVVLSKVGRYLYDKLYRNYTKKQWGVTPDKLDPQVISRIPIRMSRDDRYFDDPYQGLPKQGYARMVERMLSHPTIKLLLGLDYKEIIGQIDYEKLVYTGPLDYYFDYKYGKLPYVTLEMKLETYEQECYQPVAVVNYPNDYDFTRIVEFKHMTGQQSNKTTILKEFPRDTTAEDEPYYPVFDAETNKTAEKYREEAKKEPNTLFVGRLAEYRYYNMDIVVSRALDAFNNEVLRRNE
ncbi:UDP-galactopyranose mutase [Dehalococcoidia bacterium]|nr:UDP-galactopyranose mutase [Dehalococcoidia bacterium]